MELEVWCHVFRSNVPGEQNQGVIERYSVLGPSEIKRIIQQNGIDFYYHSSKPVIIDLVTRSELIDSFVWNPSHL